MAEQVTKRKRRSIRLPGYDYAAPGAYFVTICVRERACLLCRVVGGEMQRSEWGEIVARCWEAIPVHFPQVELDAWVVMPNHVHGIVVIKAGAQHAAPLHAPLHVPLPGSGSQAGGEGRGMGVKAGSLGAIVRSFKAAVTRQVNQARGTPGTAFWQRNYWEQVVRDEVSLRRLRAYIEGNPARWGEDSLHPRAIMQR